MNDLIGLLVLIVVFNVIARVVRVATRAAKQPQPRPEPGSARQSPAREIETERTVEPRFAETSTDADEGPFAWARETERRSDRPRAYVPAETRDEEFLEHEREEWSREEGYAATEPGAASAGDFPELFSDWSDEIKNAVEEPGVPAAASVIAASVKASTHAAAPKRRREELRRMVIHSVILAPCRAAERHRPRRFIP